MSAFGLSRIPLRRRSSGERPVATAPAPVYETVIVGGGPAGTGPLVWAARHGRLADWLNSGVALVEQSEALGGSLGQYPLNADSRGTSFLECLDGQACSSFLADLRTDPVAEELERFRGGHPTLELVDRFERRLGAALLAEFDRHPNSRALTGTRAQAIRLQRDGSVSVYLAGRDGQRTVLRAASAVVAVGGRPNAGWSEIEIAPGVHLGRWRDKIVSSHRLLSRGGAEEVARRLARAPRSPRVLVVGGAHSAFSAAWLLLERIPGLSFGPQGVRILHRSEPRPTYASRAAAHVDFYEFSESDVCPATGRVHRLGGLQGDGRELWRRMNRKPGTRPDDRAVAMPIGRLSRADLLELLADADLIVPALGYRLGALPIYDENGGRVPLAQDGPAVGTNARLLAADGTPIPRIFGAGLGSGFVPWGPMAGEESFAGQQNSLWLYQNGLGKLLYHSTRRLAQEFADRAMSCELPDDTTNQELDALPAM